MPNEITLADREPTALDLIREVARDGSVSVEKLERLVALQERTQAKIAETAFYRAMNLAQSEMEPIAKNAQNEHTRSEYATLEGIDTAVRPIYSRHGFSLTYDNPDIQRDGVTVACKVMHVEGHAQSYTLSGGLDLSGSQGKSNKTPIQALGSTVTYLRRYLLCMIFNITLKGKDQDGNRTPKGFISQQQADVIGDMIHEFGEKWTMTVQDRFFAFMGVQKVSEINASDYQKAVTSLKAKAKEWR